MTATSEEYAVEQEIAAFFAKTSATRSICDAYAKDVIGGEIVAVPVQGVCSYTIYAGADADIVVQFRLKSLALPNETMKLVHQVYHEFAPDVNYKGQLGHDECGKESLCVYIMPRMSGISRLDFLINYGFPENTPEMFAKRLTFIGDVARFFSLSWRTPHAVDAAKSTEMHQAYRKDLELLLASLPSRFSPLIRRCLNALPCVMKLPVVLAHKDFGDMNILVDPNTFHLTGVIDWAEASFEPFGINLYSAMRFMGKFHLRDGWIRYPDYAVMHDNFWQVLKDEVGGWTDETFHTIQSAMIMGVLLSRGFTSRLANMPAPVPISDDASGAYNMLYLDGWLANVGTRIF